MDRTSGNEELLAVKFMPPVLPGDLLVRKHVRERFCMQGRSSLVAVVAPAGYGKSTVLAGLYEQVVQSGEPVSWLHLDSYDDGFGFWYYFCECLRRIEPSLDFAWLRSMEDSASLENPLWTNRLINQIASVPAQFTLIIDDFQFITNENIHSEIAHIVSYLPANMRFVIASREAIPIPLARLKLQKQVLELGKDDLAFTRGETVEYLNTVCGMGLSADAAARIASSTQGWITGIKIIAMGASTGPDGQRHIGNMVSGDMPSADSQQIYDYLREEVLGSLSEKERRFLVQTACMDTLTAPLCDYALEIEDSAHMLASFEKANLFISPLAADSGSWRLHPLFREFLDARAKAQFGEQRRKTACRAAEFLVNGGHPERAVRYYIEGGAYELALDIVEDVYWSRGPRHSYTEPIVKLISQIPFETLLAHPRCMSLYIILLFGTGAGTDLDRCIKLVHYDRAPEGLTTPKDMKDWSVVQALAAYARKRYRKAVSLFDEALSQRLFDSYRTDGLLLLFKARCHYALGQADEMFAAISASADNAHTHRMVEEFLMAKCELSRCKFEFGFVDEANRIARDTLDYARRHEYDGDTLGFLRLMLAISTKESLRADALRSYFDDERAFIARQKQDFGGWICAPSFFVELAQGHLVLENFDEAEQLLCCARDYLKRNIELAFLPERITYLRLRVWSMADERAKVDQWALARSKRGRSAHDPSDAATACECLVDALAALLQGDMKRVLYILETEVASDATFSLAQFKIDYHIVKAYALAATLSHEQAKNQMAVALRLASQGQLVRHFAGWGPWVADLAHAVLLDMDGQEDASIEFRAYVAYVVETCRHYWDQRAENGDELPWWLREHPIEGGVQLTRRELQILECLVERKTTDAIASECYISRSTVQAHVHNIYRKLGVHDRVAAMEKGRQVLGLRGGARGQTANARADAQASAGLQAKAAEGVDALSVREAEVLKFMVEGQGNRDIAEQLVMSEQTVRTHVKSIYRKLGVHSRTEAIQAALADDAPRLV